MWTWAAIVAATAAVASSATVAPRSSIVVVIDVVGHVWVLSGEVIDPDTLVILAAVVGVVSERAVSIVAVAVVVVALTVLSMNT